MAEIAIPLLGLGALYVVSNQKKEKKEKKELEAFTNKDKQKLLPNTDVKPINYPMRGIDANNKPIDQYSKNYVSQYLNANQTTDKLFVNQHLRSETAIRSLSGNEVSLDNFKHNNMVPFFGAKVKGPDVNSDGNQSILDHSQGAGSQYINKSEQAPLFNPQENVQWTHGMPNHSDFIKSRQLPSTKISNVLPWEQEKVGPGLGLGYSNKGEGGFNAGMMDRDSWKPPTVDELRVKTNPKMTYNLNGLEGPLMAGVTKPEQHGIIEKNKPDKDFTLGPDRWFTTTGSTIGQTLQPDELLADNNRQTTSVQYYGATGNNSEAQASYLQGHYEPSNRPELRQNELNPVSASGQGLATDGDYGIKGYNILKNSRSSNVQPQNANIGGLNSAFKAMVAPIVDILRPTRKENFIGNMNQVGNFQSAVPKLPISNPDSVPKTTIKETTSSKIGMNYLNVSSLSVPEGGYQSTSIQIKDQERNIGDSSTIGNVGGSINMDGPMNIQAWENQKNNNKRTFPNHPNQGGMSLYNTNQGDVIRNCSKEKDMSERNNTEYMIPNMHQQSDYIPSVATYGSLNMPKEPNYHETNERMNPDILTAFKKNPYAQSLNSY